MFSHSVAIQTSSHFLQSASRFESVLLAIKALQASAQAMQSFRNFPFPLPLFSVEQVSHASAHVIQASIQF
jgi:hypothetical protein